ncbi:hypothetical protein TSAR_005682, partial [Trichomalopsis sarcophagae]
GSQNIIEREEKLSPLSHRVLKHSERREGVLVSWRVREDPYSSIGYQNTLRGERVF